MVLLLFGSFWMVSLSFGSFRHNLVGFVIIWFVLGGFAIIWFFHISWLFHILVIPVIEIYSFELINSVFKQNFLQFIISSARFQIFKGRIR